MKLIFRSYLSTSLLMGLLLLVSGCGPGGIGTVPVTGTVLVDGEPMEGVMVVFNPGDGGRAASGRTDAQGVYTLTTEVNGDGALPGSYQISVSKHEAEEDDLPKEVDPNDEASLDAIYSKVDARKTAKSKNLIEDMYSNYRGSGLTAEVKSGGENKFDFNVRGNKKR
ncbi:MAG: carboxypeptidase regulatory-like domain-containing protein [Planctomycetales bacterium]|nr:carboxypeptidase regulatory-like domain-containing protein [Planctomycetales bacterium]